MTPRPRMRIVYCEGNLDGTVGGSYYSLLYLVAGLDRQQYDPIVVFYSEHALLDEFRKAGIETQIWPRPRPFDFGARTRGGLRWLRPALRTLQKGLNFWRGFVAPTAKCAWFLVRRNATLVHLNNSILRNHDWMLAARLTGRRCVSHERGLNDSYPTAAKYFGKHLDAIICISDAVRNRMQETGADFGNLVTIPNGLDPAVMRVETKALELRTRLGIDREEPVVGMVGNIKSWKGQDTLIRAMASVCKEFPAARTLLIGDTSPADREYEQAVRGLVSSLGLGDRILFTGFQRNVADFISVSDVIVHASVLPEPFGRVILEAMAFRRPVIAARAGAVPELLEEGVTGLTFAPGDPVELAGAILALLRDPARGQRMGERGYERLVQRYHVSRNVAATERVYERIRDAQD